MTVTTVTTHEDREPPFPSFSPKRFSYLQPFHIQEKGIYRESISRHTAGQR